MLNKEFLDKYPAGKRKPEFDNTSNPAVLDSLLPAPIINTSNIHKTIESCLKKIEQAPDGGKHYTLRDVSFLFGGYVSGGILDITDARNMLRESIRRNPNNVIDLHGAYKTIDKCLDKGTLYPITKDISQNEQNLHLKLLDQNSLTLNEITCSANTQPSNNTIVRIGSEIIRDYSIITYNNEFYVYESKFWRCVPDRYYDKEITLKLGDEFSKHKLESIIRYIQAITRVKEINIGIKRSELSLINGVYNLESGILQPHTERTKSLFNTNLLELQHRAGAQCNRWKQFLDEIFNGDSDKNEKIMLLQEYMGYCLTTDVSQQKALYLLGNGSNGKSIIIKVLQRILSKRNYTSIELHELANKHYVIKLQNKLLNVCSEVDKSILKTDIFKKIVSGDSLTGDKKFKDTITFDPYCKLIFAANDLPASSDKSHGYFRRLIILKFNNIFEGKKQDKDLIKTLYKEIDGIFIWMIDGLNRLCCNGCFTSVESSRIELESYREKNNNVIAFIKDQCELKIDSNIKYEDLYSEYRQYCQDSGNTPFSKRNFRDEVLKNFLTITFKRHNIEGNCFFYVKIAEVS
ncbi:MAG: hypothetical protein KAT48_01445 [Bacteroidales bacterium]|nr:hypothetical protein [Bacteroidales bacterium]